MKDRSGRDDPRIVSIAVSKEKGVPKTSVAYARLVKDHGIEGDAHAGRWHRQVSFLAAEAIESVRQGGLDVTFGDFAENIATVGVDWASLPVGTRVKIGGEAEVEITQIGKKCHTRCAIFHRSGDCIMPRQGVFSRVLKGGTIRCGDSIVIG